MSRKINLKVFLEKGEIHMKIFAIGEAISLEGIRGYRKSKVMGITKDKTFLKTIMTQLFVVRTEGEVT